MYERHPQLEVPEADALVWRYLDFAKFVDMLERGELYLARADKMDDPWEGALSPTMEAAHVDLLARGQQDAEARLRDAGAQFKSFGTNGLAEGYREFWRETRQRVYLSCWHLGAEHESAAMWGLYAGDGRGIAIRTTFGRLERVLIDSDYPVTLYAGMVRYLDYNTEAMPFGNALLPFVHKRLSFEHERELRVLADTHDITMGDAGLRVPMSVSDLIERVYVSPTAPRWVSDLVARILKRYDLDVTTFHSPLLAGPLL